ncbi:MAG: nucleotidyltransferase family protein, partial [Candidatus Hodarchaeota archaeon]
MNPLRAVTRPEIGLLLSYSHPRIDSKHAERIKELCQNNMDWDYLLRLADRHGLMPLLFHRLNSICPEAVPGSILSRLKNHFNANLGYNRFLTGELLKLLSLFENHGILAVPFKGPVLASSVYGDLSLREFSDLDILIHKGDFMNVKNLLLSEGYVSVDGLNATQEETLM